MAQWFGRDAFVHLLQDEGVTHLFGNPGTTELPIMAALAHTPDLQFVLGLQESIVVAMADGYARASGRLTAANVHVAPGLGHAMGALYNAKFSGSPLILTAGQQEQGHGLREPMLYDPLPPIAAPLAKWSVEVTRPDDLPLVMRRAAKIALTPPTGPVFISLPGDVLNAQAEMDMGRPTRIDARTQPTPQAVAELVAWLRQAKSPALLVGHELNRPQAWAEAQALAEALGASVYADSIPYAASFPSEHPLYVGMLPRQQAAAKRLLEPHDALLVLGADLLRMSVYSPVDPLPPHVKVAHISQRPHELGKNHALDIAWCVPVQPALHALLAELDTAMDDTWRAAAQARQAQRQTQNWQHTHAQALLKAQAEWPQSPMHRHALLHALSQGLHPDTALIEEALTAAAPLPAVWPLRHEHSWYGLASGGLGFAVPGAVGMSLALPNRPVAVLVGDGSAMYGIQGLWTAARMRCPITYIVVNNRSYRIIKERLVDMQGSHDFIGMDFVDPPIDFVQLAQSMGVQAQRVDCADDLVDALRVAQSTPGPKLIDVTMHNGFSH